ncbi:MAG: helix-turn-helix transcriptional regulator [Ruminococcus sp.]
MLLRTQANLSQEDLADELHVSRQSVSKWESGISFQKSKTHFHQRLFSCFLGCLAESTAARYPNYRNHGSAGIAILRFFAVYARHLSAIGYHYAGWKN